MHRSLRLLASLLPFTFAASGCGVILGIDDFKDAPATGGGGAGGGGEGGTPTTGGGGQGGIGGATGGGGEGGAMVCTPNTLMPCYEGPPGTEDVGACKGGMMQCKADGSGYDPCKGQVLPVEESCALPSDDDCDGLDNLAEGCCIPNQPTTCYTGPLGTAGVGQCKAGATTCNADGTFPPQCPGQVLPADEFCAAAADEDCNGHNCWVWTAAKGGFGLEYGSAIATQPFQKKIVFGGGFKGSLDLGGGVLSSAGNMFDDAFLAVYNPDGAHVWSKALGGQGSELLFDVGWDMNGGIVIAGQYAFGSLDLGGGDLGAADGIDGFIARFQQDGTHSWSTTVSGAGSQRAVAVKWVTGALYVAGEFDGTTMKIAGNTLSGIAGDMYLARFGKMNTDLEWATRIGGTAAEAASGTRTMDADFVSGAALVLGRTNTPGLDLGAGPIPTGSNHFLVKYAPSGQTMWSKGFNVNGDLSVASNGGGAVLAGAFQGTTIVDPAGTPLTAANKDILVASFDGGGTFQWVKTFGGPGDQSVTVVTANHLGSIWIAGVYDTAFTLGATALPAPNLPGGGRFVARLDSSGSVVWAHPMGGNPAAITTDDDQLALIAGDFIGTADFGGGAVMAVGSSDLFVTRLGK